MITMKIYRTLLPFIVWLALTATVNAQSARAWTLFSPGTLWPSTATDTNYSPVLQGKAYVTNTVKTTGVIDTGNATSFQLTINCTQTNAGAFGTALLGALLVPGTSLTNYVWHDRKYCTWLGLAAPYSGGPVVYSTNISTYGYQYWRLNYLTNIDVQTNMSAVRVDVNVKYP